MNPEAHFLSLITDAPGPAPNAARSVLACVEPFYASVAAARNHGYQRGWLRSKTLPRPTISVGNLTTGGTGKTPVVRWLAEALLQEGRRPAVLSRGYKTADEPAMLREMLNGPGRPAVPVVADPDRAAGAVAALAEGSAVDVFLLDDGFQHRRIRRDFDLVLLDARNPLGPGLAAGHVLPRGLLRERPMGLRRADAVILTRADRADADRLAEAERVVRQLAPGVPIYHARHGPAGYVDAADRPVAADVDVTVFAACGLADPTEFFKRVAAEFRLTGRRRFPDHYGFTASDITSLQDEAGAARWVVITEKDWVKLGKLPGAAEASPSFLRAGVVVEFVENQGADLLQQILSSLPK